MASKKLRANSRHRKIHDWFYKKRIPMDTLQCHSKKDPDQIEQLKKELGEAYENAQDLTRDKMALQEGNDLLKLKLEDAEHDIQFLETKLQKLTKDLALERHEHTHTRYNLQQLEGKKAADEMYEDFMEDEETTPKRSFFSYLFKL